MIYLDHAGATPIEPAAIDAMGAAARECWAHPGAVHHAGQRTRAALADAANHVAAYLGCAPPELRWQPSASAALRTALELVLARTQGKIVSSTIEHPALAVPLAAAAQAGRELVRLPAPGGCIDGDQLACALDGASVVALASLNHELGCVQPLEAVLASGAWLVLDAVQASAWLDLAPLMRPRVVAAVSSSKLGGPPGLGVLRLPPELAYTRDGAVAAAGTPAWLSAIGLGAACAVRLPGRAAALRRATALGHRLLHGLAALRGDIVHNAGASWLGPILDVSFAGLDGRTVESAMDIRGVAIARTASCVAARGTDSAVVAAAFAGEPWRAAAATRWSIGWHTDAAAIEATLAAFGEAFALTVVDAPLAGAEDNA